MTPVHNQWYLLDFSSSIMDAVRQLSHYQAKISLYPQKRMQSRALQFAFKHSSRRRSKADARIRFRPDFC